MTTRTTERSTASAHPIEFDGVTKSFGSRTVLDELSFTVPEGSVVGLLGPNGAGKSTAMRVLLGLQHASKGQARILGHSVGSDGFRRAVKQVGSIIETPPLYRNATALQNLEIRAAAMGLSVRDAEVRNILNVVNLGERVDDKVGGFSLGMRQRVGIALALVGTPRIVVLDEPTNGLDPEGAVEMRNLIRDLPSRGATTLLCTHRLEEVEKTCNYIVVLRRGRLVAQGSVEDLIREAGGGGFVVEVAPSEVPIAVRVLESFGFGEPKVDGGTVTAGGTIDDSSRINRALVEEGVYARALHERRLSLEDAFLAMTHEDAEDAS